MPPLGQWGRIPAFFFLGLCWVVAGCGQNSSRAGAGIQSPTSMVEVGNLVFVPSAANSEVRALDLSASPRDFVRAPNPLEALSIPVLPSPQALARDVRYDSDGSEITGPYVYAWSPGSSEVSVIGANFSILKELKRLEVGAPITALAAFGPASPGGNSTLYFATFRPAATAGGEPSGILWKAVLPPPDQIVDASIPFTPVAMVESNSSGSGGVVDVILPLPVEGELVISTRGEGVQDFTAWFQVSNPSVTVTLPFTASVRQLKIQAATATIPAGQRIFALLDESSCGDQQSCTGLQAVDVDRSGATPVFSLAKDASGATMLILPHPPEGLPTDFVTAPDAGIFVPGINATKTFESLGFISTGTNHIQVFDAQELRQIDTDTASPSVDIAAPAGLDASVFLSDVAANEGTARTDVVSVSYRGIVAGPYPLPSFDGGTPVDGGTSGISYPVASDVQSLLDPNDEIVFTDPNGDCRAALTIGAVSSTVTPAAPTPLECQDSSGFSFRAGANADKPFVVRGANFGFYGRAKVGEPFTDPQDSASFADRYYFHPGSAADGGFVPRPSLQFTITALDPGLSDGGTYTLTVKSHFVPYELSTPSLGVPAALVHDQARHVLEVSYPAINGISEGALLNSDVSAMFSSGATYQ